jgi:hypothetical protein
MWVKGNNYRIIEFDYKDEPEFEDGINKLKLTLS